MLGGYNTSVFGISFVYNVPRLDEMNIIKFESECVEIKLSCFSRYAKIHSIMIILYHLP